MLATLGLRPLRLPVGMIMAPIMSSAMPTATRGTKTGTMPVSAGRTRRSGTNVRKSHASDDLGWDRGLTDASARLSKRSRARRGVSRGLLRVPTCGNALTPGLSRNSHN